MQLHLVNMYDSSYRSCSIFSEMGHPSLFVHVPNTLAVDAVNSAAGCIIDLILNYYTGAVWVDQKSKLLVEVDDLRMPSSGSLVSRLAWAALAIGTWSLMLNV